MCLFVCFEMYIYKLNFSLFNVALGVGIIYFQITILLLSWFFVYFLNCAEIKLNFIFFKIGFRSYTFFCFLEYRACPSTLFIPEYFNKPIL